MIDKRMLESFQSFFYLSKYDKIRTISLREEPEKLILAVFILAKFLTRVFKIAFRNYLIIHVGPSSLKRN